MFPGEWPWAVQSADGIIIPSDPAASSVLMSSLTEDWTLPLRINAVLTMCFVSLGKNELVTLGTFL